MFGKICGCIEWGVHSLHRGFTLVEIIVAIFTLTVVLLGLAPMAFNVLHYNNFSKNRTIAVGLAQAKIDDLKRTALSTTLTNADNDNDTTGIFTRAWTIVGGADQLTTIEVKVSWTDYTDHTMTQTAKIYQE